MNAPPLDQVIRQLDEPPQTTAALAAAGVQRFVWESRFGTMRIDVIDGTAFVNGEPVEPATVENKSGQHQQRSA